MAVLAGSGAVPARAPVSHADGVRRAPHRGRRATLLVVVAGLMAAGAACGGGSARGRPATTTASPIRASSNTYEVNGHQLYLTCAGAGTPTVVLDSGLGADHTQWDPVAELAAATGTQVCAYDRYGNGLSERPTSPVPRPIDQVVDDARTLFAVAGLKGPYVLAGTSMGGLIDREYARRFPGDVVGMVLLELGTRRLGPVHRQRGLHLPHGER